MLSSRSFTASSVAHQRIASVPIMSVSPCKWEQPELSVGLPCASLDILGRYKCWLVKDQSPAHTVWKAVSKPIISLLDDQFEHLEAGGSDLMFEMFMVGRKPNKTAPTIIFSCESKSCRQNAMTLVQKKSILAAYPGVRMAECNRLPKLLAQGEGSQLLFLPAGVYLDGPVRICGTSVLISMGPGELPRKATIGGIVCVDETLYGVTAGHAFTRPKVTSPSEMDDMEFLFFGGEDSFDSSEDEEDLVDMTSQASVSLGSSGPIQASCIDDFVFEECKEESPVLTLNSSSTQDSTGTRNSTTYEDPGIVSTPERYGRLFTCSDPDEDLDWALIKIESAMLLRLLESHEFTANKTRLNNIILYPSWVASRSLDADDLVCTGSSGAVRGRLSGVASYKRAPGHSTFQQFLTVTLDLGIFNDGDCGSWVFGLRNSAVYGQIVSGHAGTGSAYLVPFDLIFQDIQKGLEKPVELLTRSLAADNATLNIRAPSDNDDALSAGSEVQELTNSLKPFKPPPVDMIPGSILLDSSRVGKTSKSDSYRNLDRRSSAFASPAPSIHLAPPWHPEPRLSMTQLAYSYNLPCEFASISDCHVVFHPERYQEWIQHEAWHFDEMCPPQPSTCIFCDDSFESWDERMIHIGSHYHANASLDNSRPDFFIIEQLYRGKLLTKKEFDGFLVKYDYKTPEREARERQRGEPLRRTKYPDHQRPVESGGKGKGKTYRGVT